AFPVSQSIHSALDPTLAVLPGGDLAIVWSDDRNGRLQLFYRSRIQGSWTDERLLASPPGDCVNPAIAAHVHGTISLASQHLQGTVSSVEFMRFTYFSPFGRLTTLTGPTERPDSPGIVVDPGGVASVFWIDRATAPQRIWYRRAVPDSAV